MKKNLISLLAFLLIILIVRQSDAQYLKMNKQFNIAKNKISEVNVGPDMYLGFNAGFALIEQESGLAVGMFAELGMNGFSLVPQANYWKTDNQSDFEIAALARLRFKSPGIEPYVDGGIGINFYQGQGTFTATGNTVVTTNFTKLGLDIGGGIDNIVVTKSFSVFLDAKYKFIINEDKISDKIISNIKGINITAGMKFSFK
jgi:hypothetical protein